MSQPSVEIHSQINELYSKTKVTQKLKNETENPIELQIYVNKNVNCIFSSFSAKIGDSIEVKSKVIQKSKAEEKYSDSIASGKAAIFVSDDPYDSHRIIINMGNIPPKQEVIFISEFIQFVESSDSYEFELFRNLPIFKGKNSFFQNSEIKGIIELKTNNKIIKIDKKVLSEKLKIIEEKYSDENKKEYLIKYEFKDLPTLTEYNSNSYIPSNKICFETENKYPIAFCQKLPKEKELNYIIQYKYQNALNELKKESEEEEEDLTPSLFIFLIDQSYSMEGHSMEVASKALILFLQSLPAGSYYQLIGFGSDYEKYDKIPKEYTQQNIKESIKFIEKLEANKGCTDIYSPLKSIYDSNDYDNINLPKNIFLLTDGEIDDKDKTLRIIEENSNEFFIYSIGIGKDFDKDLIKNAGNLGKGNYDFCSDIKNLNQIIVKNIKNSSKKYSYDFEFNTDLDQKNNLFKLKEKKLVLRNNKIINIKNIIEDNKEKNEKIKLNIKYKVYNNEKEFEENYEINAIEIPEGNELSKLIIKDYLDKNNNLKEEEKIKIALKYQIFTEYTSLFAEVELSEKLTEEMKKEIIGDEKTNIISKNNYNKKNYDYEDRDVCLDSCCRCCCEYECCDEDDCCDDEDNCYCCENCCRDDYADEREESHSDKSDKEKENKMEIEEDKKEEPKKEKETGNNIEVKEIINEQNFVEGFWEINSKTEKIKEKYEKEFKLLKEIKDKNINDNIAITILIIYFINKEYPQLIDELLLIIQKAKKFIKKSAKDSYENIIKQIGL